MAVRFRVLGISVVLLLALLYGASSCSEGQSEDCIEAERIWADNDKDLYDECSSGSYGSCEQNYDDCREGDCVSSQSDGLSRLCLPTCTDSTDCDPNRYCVDGHCDVPAQCETFCDGTTCCTYRRDPDDPTQCIRGSCS